MTDEELTYRADLKEKNALAKNARSAKRKSRKGCSLPSDGKSKKELEAMNGPIHTLKLGKPMTWEEFRGKPESLQKEYIADILAHYEVGPAAIAAMFGISKQHCGNYLRGLGFFCSKKPLLAETNRFLSEFVDGAPAKREGPQHFELERVCLTFSGPFTPAAITERLASLIPAATEVTITVDVQQK